ncbi:MAG: amino acid permease [Gammaproteobacteria bacterium]|nr:amino acid permease [Gammaproteobacteria bacterium]
MSSTRHIGYPSAMAIVIASMVGTGVFTTLGLQATQGHGGFTLLAAWAVGGLVALCGALSYAELAAALPRSGGEYHYLREIYHPAIGVLAGWVSVVVGFAAPVALAAMALGRYAATFSAVSPTVWAVGSILAVTLFHATDVRLGLWFQVATTALKLALIVLFVAAGMTVPSVGVMAFQPSAATLEEVLSGWFWVSLIYVSYAFSGWNAATYVAGEVKAPERVLPRALIHGTVLVTTLYLLLNLVFLRSIPGDALPGTVEVGALAAANIFGANGGMVMSVIICVLLVSTISALVLAGPRVMQRIGEDLPAFGFLAVRNRAGAPYRAILAQQLLALTFILTDSFEGVLSFAGFTLSLVVLLTVLGVMVLRRTAPDLKRPYRTWGYPWTPLVFVVLSTLSLTFVLKERPVAGVAGFLTVSVGLLIGIAHTVRVKSRAHRADADNGAASGGEGL